VEYDKVPLSFKLQHYSADVATSQAHHITIANRYGALFFSARQHICYYSALYAIHRPSVHPSVCLTVCMSVRPSHEWITQRRLKLVMQPSPQSSPMTLASSRLTSPRNSKGNTFSGGAE